MLALIVSLVALAGAAYSAVVARRAEKQARLAAARAGLAAARTMGASRDA